MHGSSRAPVLTVVALLLVAAAAPRAAGSEPTSTASPAPPRALAEQTACVPPVKCCRVCTEGKACGNTCIAATKDCKKGRGCACNAADVCAEDP